MSIKSSPLIYFVLLLGILIGSSSNTIAQTVYITKTGAKYHMKDCRYLKYSSISIELKKALELGKTACSVCKPPKSKSTTQNPETVKIDSTKTLQSIRGSTMTNTISKQTIHPGFEWEMVTIKLLDFSR